MFDKLFDFRWRTAAFVLAACAAGAGHAQTALRMVGDAPVLRPATHLALSAASQQDTPDVPAGAEPAVELLMAGEQALLQTLEQVREKVEHSEQLTTAATALLGVPYRRGGSSVLTGFDCSGFVRAVYEKSLGLVLPRVAREQASAGQEVASGELRAGDLVFFNTMRRTFSHVGIYLGEGKFIHAPRTGQKVRVDDMGRSYWRQRFDGARRLLANKFSGAADAPASGAPRR